MTLPELVERGDRLIVSAPFNPEWRDWAYGNRGYWDAGSKAWVFRSDQLETVDEALREFFGEGEE